MNFFNFRQNNSGGSFKCDENAGIGINVIIQAENAADANARAEKIGIYFDGVSSGSDCECCGNRWSRQWDDEKGDSIPSIWGMRLPTLFPAKTPVIPLQSTLPMATFIASVAGMAKGKRFLVKHKACQPKRGIHFPLFFIFNQLNYFLDI